MWYTTERNNIQQQKEIMEAGEMAQLVKYVPNKQEDLSLDLQYSHKQQAYQHCVVSVLGRQKQEEPCSLLAGQSSQSVSFRCSERLSQKVKWRLEKWLSS